jgi:hypothetical protein
VSPQVVPQKPSITSTVQTKTHTDKGAEYEQVVTKKASIDSDIRNLNFTEWSKSCLIAKDLCLIRDIIKHTPMSLTNFVGERATQDIVTGLAHYGFRLQSISKG